MNIALWVVQGLLALAFLMSGVMKTISPIETLKKNMTWVSSIPPAFVRFIGIAEILGAIGLILPLATGIVPMLTVAAAIGLVIVMVAAIALHTSRREYPNVGGNVVLLLLIAFVILGRLALVPIA